MTISFSRLGNMGRMGNSLFQLCSMIGLSKMKGAELCLPAWKYAKYFAGTIPVRHPRGFQVSEPAFHHCGDFIPNDGRDYDVVGYLQSEKYWKHCEEEVRDMLQWEPKFSASIKKKYAEVFKKNTIAISCRVGDYRDNPNYEVLPAMYYILALYEHFPDWKERNLLFLSDDINWCKLHFGCLPNAYFANDFDSKEYFFSETAAEQLCVGSLCDDFIISNSTFGWWLSYLANKGKTIRPAHYLAGKLKQQCDMKDFWPEEWIEFDHKGKKFDLSDVTFTVPVQYDHNDRKQNLDLSVCMLQRDFDCKIEVGEINTNRFEYFKQWCRYSWRKMPFFHRTALLNEMCERAGTPIVCNYDADILLPPMAIILAVESLRSKGSDFVYPYNGQFARVDRDKWFKPLEKHLDVGVLAGQSFRGMNPDDLLSVGGCVMYRKDVFFEAGGENENFRSYGAEDSERFYRWNTLEYKVGRINAVLYHIDHYVGVDSTNRHKYGEVNKDEWAKVQSMNKKQLLAYVKLWPWAKQK
jgi:Glycosyl transferase family 11/N-terminal domain of galactosyltransferase